MYNVNSFNFYKTRDGPNHDCSTINRFVAAAPKLSDDMCNMTVTVLSYHLKHVTVLLHYRGQGYSFKKKQFAVFIYFISIFLYFYILFIVVLVYILLFNENVNK